MNFKHALVRIIFFGFIGVLLASCYSNTETILFPKRQELFNLGWQFTKADSVEFRASDYDDDSWSSVDLPHDWSILTKTKSDNPSGGDGGFFETGVGWYRKSFVANSDLRNKNVQLYFEGVYMNAEVYLNGVLLASQPYGYTSFFVDLSKNIQLNQSNTIAVRVDNSKQKNSRWYTGSGIYRNVWLVVKNPLHIANHGVQITTQEVKPEKGVVKINSLVNNHTSQKQQFNFLTTILNSNNKVVQKHKSIFTIDPNSEYTFENSINIKNPKLWSVETPHLYTSQISIVRNGELVDQISQSFGIRTINYSAEKGFLLNGNPIIINGGCVHHDNGCLGAAAYDRAEIRKVQLLKNAGFNAVRTSHNPPSEAFLEACDNLGLLVVDEIFDGWREQKTTLTPINHDYSKLFDEWWEHDLVSMLKRDYNHPSIIMWSIGNEIIERTSPEAVETAKMLKKAVKKIDSIRPVTSAMTTWGQGWDVFDPLMEVHDIAGYNYQLHHAEEDHLRVPKRVILNTESYPKNAFYIWNLIRKHNYIIGDFVWTAMDYLGESGIGRYYYPGEPDGEHWQANLFPWHGAYCGDIDLTGWRKPISHYRNLLYNNDERLYMAVKEPNPSNGPIKLTSWAVWPTWESWTWPKHEGQDIEVEVYSKYPKVRLYLNDNFLQEKNTSINEEFKAIFKIPYHPGVLKAVGVLEGNEVESVTLTTANSPSKILLETDQSSILANAQDLAYITVNITDNNGNLHPSATNLLEFNLSGPGVIVGVDNGNLKDPDLYVGNSRHAWNGRAIVVIKSTPNPGTISLEVTSDGLTKNSINITSNKIKNQKLK